MLRMRLKMRVLGDCSGAAATEYFGAQEVAIIFLNNIFNLKGNCVTDTNTHTYTHTRLGQINSLKGSYLKRPKCKPLGNSSRSSSILVLVVVINTE